ncbi:MAG: protein kinase [Labilithrix sp.]
MTTVLQPGETLDGKYRLTRRIGEGGMGTVFEGENIRIKRKVAIKVLHEHVATSPEFAQRFVREARASARIGSDHVCDVLDLGDLESGEKYIVMELLDGESMEARLERESQIDPKVLAPIVFEILEGLGAMHQVGVIHRDLKPANVFLCNKKGGGVSVKILDFGVAKVEASDEDPSGIHDMTTTGTMMGTPLYMSPEQARGARDVDGRTDLYAASVIFYQGLTGETPHSGVSLHELLFKIVLDDPKPIQSLAPHVDDELAGLVMRGLARDPEQRFHSARDFQTALAAWGEKHDLDFKITLPTEPPPLRKQTGGFPAAIIETAGQAMRTGNTPLSTRGNEGPPTPIDVNAVTQPSHHPAPPTSATVKAAEPTAPLKPGDTLLAGVEPPVKPAPEPEPARPEPAKPPSKSSKTPAPVAARSAPPVEPQGSSKATLVIGALVAIVAAVIGVKLGTADSGGGPQPQLSNTAPPSVPVMSTPVPSTTPSAEPSVPVATDAGATTTKDAAVGAAIPMAPAPNAPPAPRTSSPVVPSPSTAVSGRSIQVVPNF